MEILASDKIEAATGLRAILSKRLLTRSGVSTLRTEPDESLRMLLPRSGERVLYRSIVSWISC